MTPERPGRQPQAHPGGTGAVLGFRLLRFSGAQGIALGVGSGFQMISVLVVAAFLGPTEMGRYALLIFLSALVAQVLSLPSKPGTIRRMFGGGDDEGGDDDEDAAAVSAAPDRTLGTGIAWTLLLGIAGAALVIGLRHPIADGMLGGGVGAELVLWSGVLVIGTLLFKLCSMVIWLERRPTAFLAADASRPALSLTALTALLATGQGLEGAIMGTALGTLVAAAVPIFLLRNSFVVCFDLRELVPIVVTAKDRAPIIGSFWFVQNADIYLLSQFVSHADLGIYNLASRTGMVAALLPGGFRIAMRALRKGAAFEAVREQYGKATAQGQLLGYFVLVSIFAIFAVLLLGTVIVDAVPASYAAAAGLIPFCAAGFVMPPLLRMVNQSVSVSHSRAKFVGGLLAGALLFAAVIALLAPEIGTYAAPLGMLAGIGGVAALLFVNGQLGKKPLNFPYREVVGATALAALLGGGFVLLPALPVVVALAVALLLIGAYLGLLVLFRVVPEHHWQPLLHMGRSFALGTPVALNPRKGLRALDPGEREELRTAVLHGLPAARLAPDSDGTGLRLVRVLRRVGKEAGAADLGPPTALDPRIAPFVFEDSPRAVRDVHMGKLLEEGAAADDLRALEDLASHLTRVPEDAWAGRRAGGRRRRLLRLPRRRRTTRSA